MILKNSKSNIRNGGALLNSFKKVNKSEKFEIKELLPLPLHYGQRQQKQTGKNI